MVGEQKCVVQLRLLKYILKPMMVIEINHITHVKHLGKLSRANFNLLLQFRTKCNNKLNELSFTCNFDHVLIYIRCKFNTSTTFH